MKMFYDPDWGFIRSLQSRRRRFRYISNGSAKLFARQTGVEDDAALAEQSGDEALDVG